MKNVLAIVFIYLFASTATNAQTGVRTFVSAPPGVAEPVIRVSITTTFRFALPPGEGQTVPDVKSQDSAKNAFYRMAEAECAILSEIYKADCRLTNLSVNMNNTAPSPRDLATMTGSAGYELRIKGSQ